MNAVYAIFRNAWTRTMGRRPGMSVTGIVPASLGLLVQVHGSLQPQEAMGGQPDVVGTQKRCPDLFGVDNPRVLPTGRSADLQATRGNSAQVRDGRRCWR
jgi:hypothetical protein